MLVLRLSSIMYRNSSKMILEIGSTLGTNKPLSVTNYSGSPTTYNNLIEDKLYEDAISALNQLQSNAITVQESISKGHMRDSPHVKEAEKYLQRVGIPLSKLDELSVIHVAGTKGKGSTCALVESILRSFKVKTGFFSSPHLICATERIRINGKPISKSMFTKYFWIVYNLLEKSKDCDDDMPAYFKFLTIMSFYLFIMEKVDVAVVEVGIGGEYDCTNVLRNTKTIGITSLALEHIKLLGNSLEQIAWQKSGIIKTNSNVYTVNQFPECLPIIQQRTADKNAKLFIVPDFNDYKWNNQMVKLQINNKVQKLNASLAIQLAYNWLRINNKYIYSNKKLLNDLESNEVCLDITDEIRHGLENCFWPGRCQQINFKNKRLFIDGAHTIESIKICIEWFKNITKNSTNKKLLIFNSTGDRDTQKILQVLNESFKFTNVIFVPNVSSNKIGLKDTNNLNYPQQDQLIKCSHHLNYWNSLQDKNTLNSSKASIFTCLVDVFEYLDESFKESDKEIDILITGSFHLIGAALLALEEIDKTFVPTEYIHH